jgi:DNA-binding response OmpR family regulator
MGGTEYLLKPCSVEELLAKIDLAVERQHTRQTLLLRKQFTKKPGSL